MSDDRYPMGIRSTNPISPHYTEEMHQASEPDDDWPPVDWWWCNDCNEWWSPDTYCDCGKYKDGDLSSMIHDKM